MAYGLIDAVRMLVGCVTSGTSSMPSEDDVNRAAAALNLTVIEGCDPDQFKEVYYLCNSGSAPPLTPGDTYAGILHVGNISEMWDRFVTEFCRSENEETSRALLIFAIIVAAILFLSISYIVGNKCGADNTKSVGDERSDIWSPEVRSNTASGLTVENPDDSLESVLLEV